MAINITTGNKHETERSFREKLLPFRDNESAVKALQQFIGPNNEMSRRGMYLLEITNNIIQSHNGTENLYQRIPPESFGGMSEGGRRNVQTSLIARAVTCADAEESRRILDSGYTRLQETIGLWAERDGCWSDTPDTDLKEKGFIHDPDDDGSEAHVFDRPGDSRIYKTIDCSQYSDYELMLDRIAIHNATFPEMAMRVEGFGVREDASSNKDFVVVISQNMAHGRRPTAEEIHREMALRSYDQCLGGYMYVSVLDNTIIGDVHPGNAVISPNGNFLCFDCVAALKYFEVDKQVPKRFKLEEFLPNSKGRLDGEGWKFLLGANYNEATEQEKSILLKELRTTGRINGLIDGRRVVMDNPMKKIRIVNEKPIIYYEGDILVGSPESFKKEHTWKIPQLNYDEQSSKEIVSTISSLIPQAPTLETFLYTSAYVKSFSAPKMFGNMEKRRDFIDQLKKNGYIEGLVEGKYIVQLDPKDNTKVLISDSDKLRFMLWTNNTDVLGTGMLTPDEKKRLAKGETITKGGAKIRFDIDKGRIDYLPMERKLMLYKHPQEKDVQKAKDKQKIRRKTQTL